MKKNIVNNSDTFKLTELGKYNLGEHLNMWCQLYSNKIAIVDGDIKLTYSQLNEMVTKISCGFLNLGIKKKDNVLVQLPNSSSFIVICFALFRIGAIPIIAVPGLREMELDNIFKHAKPVAYIKPKCFSGFEYENMAKNLSRKHKNVKFILTDGEYEKQLNLNNIDSNLTSFHNADCNDTAILLLSGGTTNTPKLIPMTHAAFAYHAKASAQRSKITQDSTYLAILSIAHKLTLFSPGVIGTLSMGGKIVMCNTTSCEETFKLIEKEKVTITSVVPSLAKMWLEVLEWDKSYDISSLKVLLVGGSLLEESVAKKIILNIDCKIQQVYGMSEGIVCYTSLDDSNEIVCSCQGKPLSQKDKIKIVDENGNLVEQGKVGQILVKGPYRFNGYYKLSNENYKYFTADDFFYTGDKGSITAEGNIKIEGRINDQINRSGEKIMPCEIEKYIKKHPDVKDAVVIGVPDDILGQRSCAFIISKNKKNTLMEMRRYLKSLGIAEYKIPDQIEFISDWPYTGTGKIDKKQLKKMVDI